MSLVSRALVCPTTQLPNLNSNLALKLTQRSVGPPREDGSLPGRIFQSVSLAPLASEVRANLPRTVGIVDFTEDVSIDSATLLVRAVVGLSDLCTGMLGVLLRVRPGSAR